MADPTEVSGLHWETSGGNIVQPAGVPTGKAISVATGGTGANTAKDARSRLGVGSDGLPDRIEQLASSFLSEAPTDELSGGAMGPWISGATSAAPGYTNLWPWNVLGSPQVSGYPGNEYLYDSQIAFIPRATIIRGAAWRLHAWGKLRTTNPAPGGGIQVAWRMDPWSEYDGSDTRGTANESTDTIVFPTITVLGDGLDTHWLTDIVCRADDDDAQTWTIRTQTASGTDQTSFVETTFDLANRDMPMRLYFRRNSGYSAGDEAEIKGCVFGPDLSYRVT